MVVRSHPQCWLSSWLSCASEPLTRDVDLELPAARSIAIVGENGAGKTTLVTLHARLYAPSAGRILVDDCDLGQIGMEAWALTPVGAFQDAVRRRVSLRQNVAVGDMARTV